jgi:outer membrane biogenesis lipoprotein LolB
MSRLLATLAIALALSACAARTPPRPAGSPGPDPTAIDAFTSATAACRGFRSLTGELSLSGRAAGERIRGRVIAGLESGGSVRLEGVAPFGPPVFILAGKAEKATLLLPREQRVIKDTAVSSVLERLTGLALSADDLRLIVSGCLVDNAAPTEGKQWPGGWQAVSLGSDRLAYVRRVQGVPMVVAADYGPWHVDYSEHLSGYPRAVRVRRAGDATTDVVARVGELEVNTTINPLAFTLEIPADAEPMTLDELRSVAPLVPKS